MIKDYDYIVVETILRDIAFDGDWSDGQYLTFWMDGTDGYIEMEYSNYIDNYFPSDFENEIEETATIIHDSMNEECWIDIDSRELLVAFIIDFFKNNIDFDFWENKFEKGYIKNDLPTYTHSWERLFAIIVFYNNKILHTL